MTDLLTPGVASKPSATKHEHKQKHGRPPDAKDGSIDEKTVHDDSKEDVERIAAETEAEIAAAGQAIANIMVWSVPRARQHARTAYANGSYALAAAWSGRADDIQAADDAQQRRLMRDFNIASQVQEAIEDAMKCNV